MILSAKRCRTILLGACLLLSSACSPALRPEATTPSPATDALPFTENEQVAGEIMAYLIEVVLGRAGALDKRSAWSTRGLQLPLDFDLVNRRMFGPVPLRAELMVLDTNILGLSRVLYHYDPRLNLFKGRREHESLYPCSELMAIRLLLLRKLHNNETVSLTAIQRQAALFKPQGRAPVPEELAVMGLNDTEFRFLKAIFHSEPAFLRYMRHPFIVSTLRKIGVAKPEPITVSADRAATYDQLSCTDGGGDQTITIAIVPAMLPAATRVLGNGSDRKTADDIQFVAEIRTSIERQLSRRRATSPANGRPLFFTPQRPVTIHPGNADRVIGQLCPTSDFAVILLGKHVYRSLFIDPDVDIYPHKKWIYLDVDDVRYRQVDAEIETVVSAVLMAIRAG